MQMPTACMAIWASFVEFFTCRSELSPKTPARPAAEDRLYIGTQVPAGYGAGQTLPAIAPKSLNRTTIACGLFQGRYVLNE